MQSAPNPRERSGSARCPATVPDPRHAAIYGYKPDALIGRTWKTLYAPEWITRIEEQYFPVLLKDGQWTGAYHMVLMDVQMPVMDGLQATAAIRRWEREQQRTPTPIIALTANAFKEAADKSLDAGCTAHVAKPIKKKTLLATIAQYTTTSNDRAA